MAIPLSTQHWAWAHRLVLTAYTRDADMTQLVNDEIGDCGHCWRLVAHYAAMLAFLTTSQADCQTHIDDLFGGLEFALDTSDGAILVLRHPDEQDGAA
jgi:hypothetical protein